MDLEGEEIMIPGGEHTGAVRRLEVVGVPSSMDVRNVSTMWGKRRIVIVL